MIYKALEWCKKEFAKVVYQSDLKEKLLDVDNAKQNQLYDSNSEKIQSTIDLQVESMFGNEYNDGICLITDVPQILHNPDWTDIDGTSGRYTFTPQHNIIRIKDKANYIGYNNGNIKKIRAILSFDCLLGLSTQASIFTDLESVKYIKGVKNISNFGATSYRNMFYDCKEVEYIEDFINENMADVVSMESAFTACYKLKRCPKLGDTSNVKNWLYAFANCESLEEFPPYDFSGTTEKLAFYGKFEEVPNDLNLGNALVYFLTPNLKAIGNISCGNINGTQDADSLESIGNITLVGTAASINISGQSLKSIGDINAPITGSFKITGVAPFALQRVGNIIAPKCYTFTFAYAENLEEIGEESILGTYEELATTGSIASAFYKCMKLKRIPEISFAIVNVDHAFTYCESLETIPLLLCNKTAYVSTTGTFYNCESLVNFQGFKNIKRAMGGMHLEYSPLLSYESLISIINNTAEDTTEAGESNIYFHADAYAKLTEEDIAIAVNKGWTIASA